MSIGTISGWESGNSPQNKTKGCAQRRIIPVRNISRERI